MERDSGSLKSVLAFYKFFEIRNTAELREDLLKLGASLELKGTVLVADEGLNSTLAGNKENLDRFSAYLVERFGDFPFKWSVADESNEVFFRFKVKIKSEIVTMGVEGIDPALERRWPPASGAARCRERAFSRSSSVEVGRVRRDAGGFRAT